MEHLIYIGAWDDVKILNNPHFDNLNITEAHPCRNDHDNFYVDDKKVLRSHTTSGYYEGTKYGVPSYFLAVRGLLSF